MRISLSKKLTIISMATLMTLALSNCSSGSEKASNPDSASTGGSTTATQPTASGNTSGNASTKKQSGGTSTPAVTGKTEKKK